MPLSISSSDRLIPSRPWTRILVLSVLSALLFGILLEFVLANKGFQATALDTPELWIEHRTNASSLGEKALIIIGGSRIQLGLDLSVLRSHLSLVPIQLAVDGSSWLSVLKGLAEDETIRGTVMVDYYDHTISNGLIDDFATEFQRAYEAQAKHSSGWAVRMDRLLERCVRRYLRSYADGARPITSFLKRALGSAQASQYLLTFPDRSRDADYQKVPMPSFYYSRALRHAGVKLSSSEPVSAKELDRLLQEKIDSLRNRPFNDAPFLENAHLIKSWIERIRARGGDVFFVRMPVSGFVRQVDEAMFAREVFYDRFGQISGAKLIHFLDHPTMSHFTCPDGSHLDYRDKPAFTLALVNRIREENIAK